MLFALMCKELNYFQLICNELVLSCRISLERTWDFKKLMQITLEPNNGLFEVTCVVHNLTISTHSCSCSLSNHFTYPRR